MKESDVTPPTWIMEAPNALASVGGVNTVNVAVAACPVTTVPLAAIAEIGPVLFIHVPGVVPTTVAETTQLAPAARDAPDSDSEVVVPIAVPLGQFEATLAGIAVIPAGRVSVKATIVIEAEAGLIMVIDRVDVPPTTTVGGLNDLVIVGAPEGASAALHVPLIVPPAAKQVRVFVMFAASPLQAPVPTNVPACSVEKKPIYGVLPLKLLPV